MKDKEREVDYTDHQNELTAEEKAQGMPTCRVAHSVYGNANCTGICQRRKGHIDADHRDQHGHWY